MFGRGPARITRGLVRAARSGSLAGLVGGDRVPPAPAGGPAGALQVEGAVALAWGRGRHVDLPSLRGPRPLPLAFGAASLSGEELTRGMTNLEFGCRARLHSFDEAYVVMGRGDDGVVLTPDLRYVVEPSAFSQIAHREMPARLEQAVRDEVLHNVVVGVDGASHNYYHWLLYALARSRLCAERVPGSEILLPDYDRMARTAGRLSPAVMRDATRAILGPRRHRRLQPGVYPVRGLTVLWTRPVAPTDITSVAALYPIFDEVADRVRPATRRPRRRLFFARRGVDQRVPQADQAALDRLLTRYGFEWVDLATLSFEAQVRTAMEAEIVVAPHGAGLTNLLFTPRQTVVIELIERLNGEANFRPWFYQLATGRGQRYGAVHTAQPDWLETLRVAIRRCLNLGRA